MRHADYKTAQQHYTVLGLADMAKAIESLPDIPTAPGQPAALKATETDGRSGDRAPQQFPQQLEHDSVQKGASRCDDEDTNSSNTDDD